MVQAFKKDTLTVKVFNNRKVMGKEAATEAAVTIRLLLKKQQTINIIFAAAPSQIDFLEALLKEDISWPNINAFHMDEYIGLPSDSQQGFANFLATRIFNKVNFKSVNFLNGNADVITEEAARYSRLLTDHPPDIVFMGIGENAHIAFNDPHVADFFDKKLVKVVDLDKACRQQQVNDGCFERITDVPTHALTLTIPALTRAKYIFCIVPSRQKANAVYRTLHANISEHYPSTVLRKHENAVLYTDKDSSSLILNTHANQHQ